MLNQLICKAFQLSNINVGVAHNDRLRNFNAIDNYAQCANLTVSRIKMPC